MAIRIVFSFLIMLVFSSCISQGYTNQYGIYVPKRPKYELKNVSFELNPYLDLENLYGVVRFKDINANHKIIKKRDDWTIEYAKRLWIYYYKFYPNGRVSSFIFFPVDKNGNFQNLSSENLDPKYHKQGYFITTRDNLKIEEFLFGDGNGFYSQFNYKIRKDGSLEALDSYSNDVYSIEKLPDSTKKYDINW